MSKYRSLFNRALFPAQAPLNKRKEYYAYVSGRQAGPLSEQEIKKLVDNGSVDADTLVWTENMAQWMPAMQVPAIYKLLLLTKKIAQVQKPIIDQQRKTEVLSALMALGYKKAEISKRIDDLISKRPEATTADIVKAALKALA